MENFAKIMQAWQKVHFPYLTKYILQGAAEFYPVASDIHSIIGI